MATFDLSNTQLSFHMDQTSLVNFQTAAGTMADHTWRWNTLNGGKLTLEGLGMTFDGGGRAETGRIARISFDLAGDGGAPDVVIDGLNVAAPPLDDSQADFWAVLSGNDTIKGPNRSATQMIQASLTGDMVATRAAKNDGGDDWFTLGTAQTFAAGDAFDVLDGHELTGGDDVMSGGFTVEAQILAGDARSVLGTLNGGGDTMILRSSNRNSLAAGDALLAEGKGKTIAHVIGGADTIDATIAASATLSGDVRTASLAHVIGGADHVTGTNGEDVIAGDAIEAREATVIGGADTLLGRGGADEIAGDMFIFWTGN